ncbi:MAG: hypothetical protein ACPGSC_05495 [Granulosicoccaceae bacterium]
MPEQKQKLQQRFDQLPDPKPPLGMDTRIKAQARAAVEKSQTPAAKHTPWTGGLATAACAVLALFLTNSMLDSPLKQSSETELNQLADEINEEVVGEHKPQLMRREATPMPSSAAEQYIDNGGGASPKLKANSSGKVAVEELLQAEPTLAAPINPQPTPSANVKAAEVVDADTQSSFEELLQQWRQHIASNEIEKAQLLEQLIKRHYPEQWQQHLEP